MEKSNPNLLQTIKQKLFGDAILLVSIRLTIAKTMFILLAFLYFFTYLLIIGGYHVDLFNKVIFFLYPLFAFATVALLYNIIRYTITIYIEKSTVIIYIIFFLLSIVYVWLIATHTGFNIQNLTLLSPGNSKNSFSLFGEIKSSFDSIVSTIKGIF